MSFLFSYNINNNNNFLYLFIKIQIEKKILSLHLKTSHSRANKLQELELNKAMKNWANKES